MKITQYQIDVPSPFLLDLYPSTGDLFAEVYEGLTCEPKYLPPKLFYDQTGSELFNRITRLPEYYLTRVETELLRTHAGEFSRLVGKDSTIVEYGCGNSEKIRTLLDSLLSVRSYVAIDISRRHLWDFSKSMAEIYPHLEVIGVCADFTAPLIIPAGSQSKDRIVAFFPGSSIGNFEPLQAQAFLRNIAETVGLGGGLLIGVDVKKDPQLLDAAYNDAEGITALFNLNLLNRLNEEFTGTFILKNFDHHAFYDAVRGRIEMHLVSHIDQTVHLRGVPIPFRGGETIHTENSYKYDVAEFQALAQKAGWTPVRVWTDEREFFSLHYFEHVSLVEPSAGR